MFSLLIPLSLILTMHEPVQASLSIEITNVRSSGGTLRVALYKPGAKFGKSQPDFYKNTPVKQSGKIVVDFEVPPGRYAVAVYHDLNDNNKLDKNLVGYPKEPFGFSNNYRPVVSGPDFQDCAFELTNQGKSISIKLID
ncbi:DUF2141 domain-containing protein [Salmonirosea aquatica]|uniref:DUF2141 domain-containing protein n=1 Tax=Salmonirosea aquatica TaxID=2654236 RepID=A0A7C9FYU5_9BACT|nr:DUF2141 domain-containing protein [Cytophagaceae bacterium SJW1-29]